MPQSVVLPTEVIGKCYIYQPCNLIFGILEGCAHTIPPWSTHCRATASHTERLSTEYRTLVSQMYHFYLLVVAVALPSVCTVYRFIDTVPSLTKERLGLHVV